MADEARVASVHFDTAPDSESLIVIVLQFPNGGRSQLQLDGRGAQRLIQALGLATITELVGRPFSQLAPALPANAKP